MNSKHKHPIYSPLKKPLSAKYLDEHEDTGWPTRECDSSGMKGAESSPKDASHAARHGRQGVAQPRLTTRRKGRTKKLTDGTPPPELGDNVNA